MPQKDLILQYIDEHGSITPAKVLGHSYRGGIIPAEASKRCREMRAKGILVSEKDGKFEKFRRPMFSKEAMAEISKTVDNSTQYVIVETFLPAPYKFKPTPLAPPQEKML